MVSVFRAVAGFSQSSFVLETQVQADRRYTAKRHVFASHQVHYALLQLYRDQPQAKHGCHVQNPGLRIHPVSKTDDSCFGRRIHFTQAAILQSENPTLTSFSSAETTAS